MKLLEISRKFIVLLIVIILAPSVSAIRAPIPSGVFYYRPASLVNNSSSAWINPSAIAWNNEIAVQFMADYSNETVAKSWGFVVQRESIVTAYRYLDNPEGENYREYLVATGFHLGRNLVMGGSYRYFKDAPGIYNKRHYWTLSVSGRLNTVFDWAAVLSNLNRGKIDGVRTATEQLYSLTYNISPGKLSLSVDALFSTDMAFNDADFIYHAEWIPSPGLYIDGYIDSYDNFQLGLRVNLTQYFMGWQSIFRSGGSHSRSTAYIGSTSKDLPTFLK